MYKCGSIPCDSVGHVMDQADFRARSVAISHIAYKYISGTAFQAFSSSPYLDGFLAFELNVAAVNATSYVLLDDISRSTIHKDS